MEAIGTIEIHTPRLKLRKICTSDAADLYSAGALGESLQEAEEIISNMMQYNDDPYSFHWVLEYEGNAIGRVKAWEVNCRDNYAQLGYDIGPDYRSMGLMTEAVRAVTMFLLSDAQFNRVYCMVRETNIPSIRVCEKAGMVYEGTMRKHFAQEDGTYVDVLIYGRIRDDSPKCCLEKL